MLRDGAKAKVGEREIDFRVLSVPFVVQKVNGDWLWTGRAWLKKADVVPLEQAAGYYTEYLRNNPTSSWA